MKNFHLKRSILLGLLCPDTVSYTHLDVYKRQQLGLLLVLVHLCALRSFGTPYFVPLGPMMFTDWRDVFVRTWWWDMLRRPHLVGIRELDRQQPGQMPRPEPRRKDDDW